MRLQYSAALTSLREVPRQTLTPARKTQLAQVLTYEKEVSRLAPIIDALFSEQLRGEIMARGCKEEALRLVAKSKKGLVLAASKNAAKPNTLPPATPQNAPFSVNNIDCSSPFVVFIDGAPIGTASANSTTSFSASNGAHSLEHGGVPVEDALLRSFREQLRINAWMPHQKRPAKTWGKCRFRFGDANLSPGDFRRVPTDEIIHACSGVSLATGGKIPNASHVRKIMSEG